LILRVDPETRRFQQPSGNEAFHKFQHFPETRTLSSFINSEEPAVLAGRFASDSMAGALADESGRNDGVECQT